MAKAINLYRKNKDSAMQGMSGYSLVMRMYRELESLLTECHRLFRSREKTNISTFFNMKSNYLTRVISITTYLIETNDDRHDKELFELFSKMYHYILVNAIEANKSLNLSAIDRALLMTREIIGIWDSIPQKYRN